MTPDDNQPSSQSPHYIGRDHELPSPGETAGSSGRTSKIVIWAAVLLIFAVALVLVIRHQTTPSTPAGGGGRRGGAAGGTVVLNSVTATQGDIGVYVSAIGTVTPVYTANIVAEVNGQVTAVRFTEGQMVRKGSPLIEIDPRPYEATLMQAQGTLQRDQNVLAQAQMDLTRYQTAWAKNAIPKQQLDDQEKLVLQDQGTVKVDEGTVKYDEVQVSFCHIRSPITGKVGLRLVDPGNVVQANGTTPLAVVTQMQPITVVFSIPEDSLAQIEPQLAQHAKLGVDALDRTGTNKLASGTLLTLDNQIDTTTGTLKARAQFPNTDGVLYPNEFVNARLLVQTEHNQTLVPSSVIQHNGTVAFVYVLQDGTAHIRNVQVGVTDGNQSAVTGINPGDKLANSGFEKLQDGAKYQEAGAGGGSGGGKHGRGGASGATGSTGNGAPASAGSTAP